MDVDWCLTCGRRTNDVNEAYCSKTCMRLDSLRLPQSLPIAPPPRRRSFDVPSISPCRHSTSKHKSQPRAGDVRLSVSDGFALGHFPSKARFRDDELQDRPSTLLTGQWTGKDREGILVWAHAVSPGLEEDCAPPDVDAASMTDMAVLAAFRFTRPPPFPLTAQNLAPPCITILPRHALLNHTALHYDPTVPSLSQDDASLLTPATESVITPSVPDTMPLHSSKSTPLVGRLVNKVCSWIAAPARTPRAVPEGNPMAPFASEESNGSSRRFVPSPPSIGDKTDITRSSAIRVANPSAKHARPPLSSGSIYDYDAA